VLRRAFQIVAAVVLGVLTTVAVAWGFAWHERELTQPYLLQPPGPRLVVRIPPGEAPEPYEGGVVAVEVARSPGTALWSVSRHAGEGLPGDFVSRGELSVPGWVRRRALTWEYGVPWDEARALGGTLIARGWPIQVLWSDVRHARAGSIIDNGALYFSKQLAKFGPSGRMVIYPMASAFDVPFPLRPIWGAFLGCSAGYAGVWWIICRTPGWIARASRRLGGRCVGCGYSKAGLLAGAPCPECGRVAQHPPPAQRPSSGTTSYAVGSSKP